MLETEGECRILFEKNPIPMWVFDRDSLEFLDVNQAAIRHYGFSREEFLSMTLKDIRPPEDVPRFLQVVPNFVADTDFRGAGPWRHCKKDGTVIEVDVAAHTFNYERGSACICILNDVTERMRTEEALRASEEQVKAQYKNIPVPTYSWRWVGGDFVLVDFNTAAVDITRGRVAELVGRRASGMYPDRPDILKDLSRCFIEKVPLTREMSYRLFDKSAIRDMVITYVFIPPDLVVVHAEDVTERKRAEEQVRFQVSLLDQVRNAVVAVDLQLRVIYWNKYAETLYQWKAHEAIGQSVLDLLMPAESQELVGYIMNTLQVKGFHEGEFVIQRKDGIRLPVYSVCSAIYDSQRKIAGFVGIAFDISERKKAEDELRELSILLLQSQDEERRRIARELHDSTAQSMAGLCMNLGVLNESAAALDPRGRRALAESLALAHHCSREIRTISFLLHPPVLDELGLMPALNEYVEGFAQRSGVPVDMDVPSDLGRLPQDVETALFRIVQECLTNISRHSGSPRARIGIARTPGQIVMEVSDEGHGITGQERKRAAKGITKLGVGIPGMCERVKQLGGKLKIDSAECGTAVRVILPLS